MFSHQCRDSLCLFSEWNCLNKFFSNRDSTSDNLKFLAEHHQIWDEQALCTPNKVWETFLIDCTTTLSKIISCIFLIGLSCGGTRTRVALSWTKAERKRSRNFTRNFEAIVKSTSVKRAHYTGQKKRGNKLTQRPVNLGEPALKRARKLAVKIEKDASWTVKLSLFLFFSSSWNKSGAYENTSLEFRVLRDLICASA